MHLAQRAYVLIVLTAVMAIVGVWAEDPLLSLWWRAPAILFLAGIAFEAFWVRRAGISAGIEIARRGYLGRALPAAFVFRNASIRRAVIEFVPLVPEGFEFPQGLRRIAADPLGTARWPLSLLPVRLGCQSWPAMPARLLGALGFAWWSVTLHPKGEVAIGPDTLREGGVVPRGNTGGVRPRRFAGPGSELYQLRQYVPGDPLARIDWKASARAGTLTSRDFSEDQHLDILIAIDASRLSGVRAGRLDRLGVYANLAARLAEVAAPNDDRIGLFVFSDRPLAVCAPERGLAAVARISRTLARVSCDAGEPDLIAAAVRMRRMLRHRSLIVLLTDLDDPAVGAPLLRAIRLLSMTHVVVVAGVRNMEIAAMAERRAQDRVDPWIALAAREHEARAESQRMLLRRLGAPVVSAREDRLERAVIAQYEALRRNRRV